MEKFDLLVLVIDKDSLLLDATGQELSGFLNRHALANATLVVIYICDKANRIISGQQISDIDTLPDFDDSEGRTDVTLAIQGWIYEAQANMYSGSMVQLRTAIFIDICGDVKKFHHIEPAKILGNLEKTEYFQMNRDTNTYELAKVSKISKLEALAKSGDEKALYELGIAYHAGDGVKKNELRAQMLLYKAYLRGNIDAIFALVDLIDEPAEYFREEAAKHRSNV